MMISSSPSTRRAPAIPRRRGLALAGISVGYFMVILDMSVLSVAEPGIARSLHASTAGLQWVVTGYTVAFSSLLLSAGAVADRFGAHRLYRGGIALFGLGSLASALAPSLGVLVALRAVLGVAAAAAVPASLALISRLYTDPGERGKAIGVWAATSGTALAAGPVAGGLLIGAAGWRAIFLINVPVAALSLTLTAGRAVAAPRGHSRVDAAAQLLACLSLALVTDALIAAGSGALIHAGVSAAAAVAAGGFFARAERRSATPVLNRQVLSARGIPGSLLAGAAVNFALTGTLFVLPLVFERHMHLSALQTGLAFLPMTLPVAFNPVLTARIVARTGPRPPVLAGMALLVAAGASFGAAGAAGAGYPAYLAGLVCTGFGVSSALPPLVIAIASAAPQGTAGVAGGLLNAARQAGASIGIAATGAFVPAAPAGARAAIWALLPALACAAGASVMARRPPAA
jgi:DHA2 family methylenomycin A resistance protein-like MFS transporter